MKAAILGYGEAGTVFAAALRDGGWIVAACDIDAATLPHMEANGIIPANDHADAVRDADLIVSVVTTDEAIAAAMAVGPLTRDQTFLDLNSVAPATKAAVASAVTGCAFVEGVAMDMVSRKGRAVPLLLSGPTAGALASLLGSVGLNVRVVGSGIGQASAIKLTRSILMKGLDALFADAVRAGGKFGVTDEVIASIQATFPGISWREVMGYHLAGMAKHGTRRAGEMRECAAMLDDTDLASGLVNAIAETNAKIGSLQLEYDGDTVEDFLGALTGTPISRP